MATVTVNGLECGVTYNIIAGGLEMVNGDLVGPRSFHSTATGPCLPGMTKATGKEEINLYIMITVTLHVQTYMYLHL